MAFADGRVNRRYGRDSWRPGSLRVCAITVYVGSLLRNKSRLSARSYFKCLAWDFLCDFISSPSYDVLLLPDPPSFTFFQLSSLVRARVLCDTGPWAASASPGYAISHYTALKSPTTGLGW